MEDLLLILGLITVIAVNFICWYTFWTAFMEEKIQWNRVFTGCVAYILTMDLFYRIEGLVLPDNAFGIIVKFTLMAVYFYVAYSIYSRKKRLDEEMS